MKTLLSSTSIFIICLMFMLNFSVIHAGNFYNNFTTQSIHNTDLSSQQPTTKSSDTFPKLNFDPSNNKIEHVFRISMSKKDFSDLQKTKDLEKDYLSTCSMVYNNDSLSVKKIDLRGKNSMFYKRKSLSVTLNKKTTVLINGQTEKFKRFNLISLSMDQNYFRNRVAFELMSKLGLFNLIYTYAEVIINGETQGVYLMVEKPKNYAFKKEKAEFMVRRSYKNEMKKVYYKEKVATKKQKEYEEAFTKIYNMLIFKGGQDLYTELSKTLDLEQYYSWMAFNFLIGNGDYTDEVFFYNKAVGNNIKFGIIPWDYDDIFMMHPHEGTLIKHLNVGDRLAFSSEDALDLNLINDNYSYAKYKDVLETVLEKLSPLEIKHVFETTYQELYPYYQKKSILKVSKSNAYGKTDLAKLQLDMQNVYSQLVHKREETLLKLNNKLSQKK